MPWPLRVAPEEFVVYYLFIGVFVSGLYVDQMLDPDLKLWQKVSIGVLITLTWPFFLGGFFSNK